MDSDLSARETGAKIALPEIPELKTHVDLSGQVAIITGAGRGIGFGIARGLAQSGAHVVIVDVDAAVSQEAASLLTAAGYAASGAQADVADEESVNALVERVAADHGRIDILVNNASVSTQEIIEQTPIENWRRVLDVDLTGPFICSKAVLPHMTTRRHGRIVTIGSIASGRIASVHSGSYTAAKAGVEAFTRHLAYEVAGRGVTVNVVNPGSTLTPRVAKDLDEAGYERRAKGVPRGRLTVAEDVMRLVLFLVSDLAEMVCGQAIDVDGGITLGWTDTDTYFKRRGITFA
jgi:NAD(P)-dependent dehydrogenase (short-subunit alcohol dehydrogenase family)